MASTEDMERKMQCAAVSVLSKSPTEALGISLINDIPTIGSAIKNMMSLCVARTLSSSNPNESQIEEDDTSSFKCYFIESKNSAEAALFCARVLSKAINSFVIPENMAFDKKELSNDDCKMEYEVVRVVWNKLIENNQKPTKILGLQSLIHVYPFIKESLESTTINFPDTVDSEEAVSFFREFGTLLEAADKHRNVSFNEKSQKDSDKEDEVDDDSFLLWAKDGGKAELSRRRKRREHHASFFARN